MAVAVDFAVASFSRPSPSASSDSRQPAAAAAVRIAK